MILSSTITVELEDWFRSKRGLKSTRFSFKKPDSKRRGKDKDKWHYQEKVGSREDNWVGLICFYMFEGKPSSYIFIESPLLISNLTLLNTGANLKGEKESEERDKKKKA